MTVMWQQWKPGKGHVLLTVFCVFSFPQNIKYDSLVWVTCWIWQLKSRHYVLKESVLND